MGGSCKYKTNANIERGRKPLTEISVGGQRQQNNYRRSQLAESLLDRYNKSNVAFLFLESDI